MNRTCGNIKICSHSQGFFFFVFLVSPKFPSMNRCAHSVLLKRLLLLLFLMLAEFCCCHGNLAPLTVADLQIVVAKLKLFVLMRCCASVWNDEAADTHRNWVKLKWLTFLCWPLSSSHTSYYIRVTLHFLPYILDIVVCKMCQQFR